MFRASTKAHQSEEHQGLGSSAAMATALPGPPLASQILIRRSRFPSDCYRRPTSSDPPSKAYVSSSGRPPPCRRQPCHRLHRIPSNGPVFLVLEIDGPLKHSGRPCEGAHLDATTAWATVCIYFGYKYVATWTGPPSTVSYVLRICLVTYEYG